MAGSSNPLYGRQWHFDLIGDMETVWAEYDGSGVHVAVVDDGVQAGHPDLADNYLGLHYAGGYGTDDGAPIYADDDHGTAVAGLIASVDNGIGTIGVAHGADLSSINLLSNAGSFNRALDMLRFTANYDVVNASWGYAGDFSTSVADGTYRPEDGGDAEGATIATAVETGRGGLGTIFVKAAGNDGGTIYGNAGGEWLNSLHHTITVGATDRDGVAYDYSSHGANILISAPAGSQTTDRTGSAGYAAGDYTNTFGGTSAATPVVAGVTALMLDAAPDLGWRDVQNILAASAAQTGSALGGPAGATEAGAWFSNGATNWNGGGMTYSQSYGYGLVDAHAAVRMAEAWHLFGAPATAANDRVTVAGYTGAALPIGDFGSTSASVWVATDIEVEHIYVEIEGDHTWIGDLDLTLVAPDGTAFELAARDGGSGQIDGSFTFGVAGARGMGSAGRWRLEVSDGAAGDVGSLDDVTLTFVGAASSPATVHHVTDDFAMLASAEGARRVIEDTDGGLDWLNLVAVTGDVKLLMGTDGRLAIDGATLARIDPDGAAIENAALGDGDDTVRGSAAGNALHGGRGDDVLQGNGGNDTIHGQAGNDSLLGDAGSDTLSGGAGADVLWGGDLRDRLDGGVGDDVLYGGGGSDLLYGGLGADTLRGGDGGDLLRGNADRDFLVAEGGDDHVLAGSGDDRAYGHAGDDTLIGEAGRDALWGNDGRDSLLGGDGLDTLVGGADNDRLYGGADRDILYGQSGDDLLRGDAGADVARGGAGRDSLFGDADADLLVGEDGDDFVSGGADDDRVYGQAGDDRVYGGSGADWIEGGDGRDLLSGWSGDDTMLGGTGADTLEGQDGSDVLNGGSGADRLIGGAGDDRLWGKDGVDYLVGGTGDDLLYGGADADVFVFGGADIGDDRVADFGTGDDRLFFDAGLGGGGAGTAAAFVDAHASVVDGNVVFDFGAEGRVTLLGVADLDRVEDALTLV